MFELKSYFELECVEEMLNHILKIFQNVFALIWFKKISCQPWIEIRHLDIEINSFWFD